MYAIHAIVLRENFSYADLSEVQLYFIVRIIACKGYIEIISPGRKGIVVGRKHAGKSFVIRGVGTC